MLTRHYKCTEDPENLEQDQQRICNLIATATNKKNLKSMRKDIRRIEDALLHSTNPALTTLQDEMQHIRETYPESP